MPDQQNPTAGSPTVQPTKSPKDRDPRITDDQRLSQNQADSGGSQSQRQERGPRRNESGDPDRVEIGDPVPEKDRTVRADDGTNDLPGADDNGGGTTIDPDPDPSSERH